MRQGGGVRRAGRAGAGEEERLPAPGGSTASRPGHHGGRRPRRGPRGHPSAPEQPGDLGGKTVTPAQPGAAAPPLALGPSRSRYPGAAAPDATPTHAFAPLTCTATDSPAPGPRPVKRFKSTAVRKGAKAH
nr:translation initiation factor IF-2-like [Peromyscus maniculatus bairdii]